MNLRTLLGWRPSVASRHLLNYKKLDDGRVEVPGSCPWPFSDETGDSLCVLATRNKCIATGSKCLTSSNKKLLGLLALLLGARTLVQYTNAKGWTRPVVTLLVPSGLFLVVRPSRSSSASSGWLV